MSHTGREYPIRTVMDLLNVPDDRLDTCLEELATWVRVSRAAEELASALADEVGAEDSGLRNAGVFRWIDDGERNMTIRIRTPNDSDTHDDGD